MALKGAAKTAANRKRLEHLLNDDPLASSKFQEDNRKRQGVHRRKRPDRVDSHRPTFLSVDDLSKSVGFNPLPKPRSRDDDAESSGWSDQTAAIPTPKAWSPGQFLADKVSYNQWWRSILVDLGQIKAAWDPPLDPHGSRRKRKAPHLDKDFRYWPGSPGLAYVREGDHFLCGSPRLDTRESDFLGRCAAPDPDVPLFDYRASTLLRLTEPDVPSWRPTATPPPARYEWVPEKRALVAPNTYSTEWVKKPIETHALSFSRDREK